MARIARVVACNYPHHIIQRGNRRQKVFFSDKDYQEYLRLLSLYAREFALDILTYCLMPNHVHIIAIPKNEKSLARAIGETHRNYTRMVNFRENWRGYLWQGRFSSYVLDESYLLSATKYILFNPVRAKIVKKPQDYKYSSIKHHLGMENNPLIADEILKSLIGNWEAFLKEGANDADVKLFKLHEKTGRPLGAGIFIEKLEKMFGVCLRKRKPGPKTNKNK